MNEIDINQILGYLPHRYPFILVDRVLDYEPYEYLVGIKNVTVNEYFFQGHFPERPIMPGVLMLEALAQACVILWYKSIKILPDKEYLHYFAGVDNARFKQIVTPGDQLHLKVTLTGKKRDIWRMHGEATVADKLVCSADLMCAAKEITD